MLKDGLHHHRFILAGSCMWPEEKIKEMVYPDVTDDRVFGLMTSLTMPDFFDPEKVNGIRTELSSDVEGIFLIYGTGASLLCPNPDILVYADMARWEIQLRMRNHLVDSLGVSNRDTNDWMLLYKQAYFVDWRVCDHFKKQLFNKWDFLLDTNNTMLPKMIEGRAVLAGMEQAVNRPFSVVPFFDPGPWGGQWMKEVCDPSSTAQNLAWCFNCVPEENSLLLKFGDNIMEIPSVNLVFRHPQELLGQAVYERFGDEFPIRFDFLDTMEGGHLSLQVHPLVSYIKEQFGMDYTQDESYYMLDAAEDASVYLGLREDVNPGLMVEELKFAQAEGTTFDVEKHVQTWPAKQHDHFLIQAGTVHCSGKGSMVLEISATPYIFTFKLWDWGRVGLDGKPRPINIEHGEKVIQWDRTTNWTAKNLVNRVEEVARGDGWWEEKTGLHELEFIETRRHWFTNKVAHHTNGNVNVICLVEGDQIVVESPEKAFEPFVVNYAETFIVPAGVGAYTIRPFDDDSQKVMGTLKAFVRT